MLCGDDRRALKLPTRRRSPDRSLASSGPRLVLAIVSSLAAMMSPPSSFAAEIAGNQEVPNPPDPPPVSEASDPPPVEAPLGPFRFRLNFGIGGYAGADVKSCSVSRRNGRYIERFETIDRHGRIQARRPDL